MINRDILRVYVAFTVCLKCYTFHGTFTNEFFLKINTSDDEQIVEKHVKDAGLLYVKKFGLDVYRVKDESLPEENNGTSLDNGNIAELLRIYGNKVTKVEQQETLYVRFNYPQETPNTHGWLFENRGHSGHSSAKIKQCPPYYGMGIERAWAQGYTGSGVTVAVLDIGVEVRHEDLHKNFNKKLSYNVWDDNKSVEPKPLQSYPELQEILNHGNEMACLIAAVKDNELCSAGVAFNASFVVLKTFELIPTYRGRLSMKNLSLALSHHIQSIDVYSCSFSFGSPFKSLQMDITEALRQGVTQGRQGKGSVFVFPTGDNRGSVFDCNVDPLVNSIFTFTIASVGVNGTIPKYAIPCAATLASTFGDGRLLHENKMITCSHGNACKDAVDGVSAATAIGAAIIALTLEANKNLTWRDLQHIIIKSSSLEALVTKHSDTNGAGLQFHRYFGYGLMNASMMTFMASNWTNVAPQEVHSFKWTNIHASGGQEIEEDIKVHVADDSVCIESLEHVMISVDIETGDFCNIGFIIISPSKTESIIMDSLRINNDIKKRQEKRVWNFTSTQFWGENATGVWRLVLKLKNQKCQKKRLKINSFVLKIYGPRTKLKCKQDSEKDNSTPETSVDGKAIYLRNKDTISGLGLIFLFLLLLFFVCLMQYGFYRHRHPNVTTRERL